MRSVTSRCTTVRLLAEPCASNTDDFRRPLGLRHGHGRVSLLAPGDHPPRARGAGARCKPKADSAVPSSRRQGLGGRHDDHPQRRGHPRRCWCALLSHFSVMLELTSAWECRSSPLPIPLQAGRPAAGPRQAVPARGHDPLPREAQGTVRLPEL